ncbi:hypothetical protein ABEB36_011654 [Hypothenemus hampei]|uniref:ADAMTS cysteine-rich domain-containing protein n=1 Tax=Hypothenemus hampei TaxID=57062 RepID=A0ABD1E9C1_HYPHA
MTLLDLDDIDCSHLGCEVDGNCTGIAEMLADGTKCNKDKWCIHGKCVTKGTRPQAVDGGWGEWGPWSACTRSCGRGTQHQERLCDNPQPSNTGKICVGSRVKIRICNPQECPMDAVPFREQACIEHLKTLNRTDEKVIGAQYKRDSPCTMYCFLKKEGEKDIQLTSFYNTPLPDGAKCEIGNPLKMCVMSKCMEVACDNQIEKSTAVLDRCGICNGPGTQCNVIDESRTIPKANKKNVNAKVLVTVVPAGSKKVKITKEPSMSKLMLGLPDNRTFYFNEKTFMWVGVHNLGYNHKEFFLYTHTELPDKTISEEVLWDMTPEDVGVYVEISFTDTKVKWHWIELLNNPKIEPKYRWDIVEYKRCTAKCEGGIQEPMINCLEETAGKVADAYCEKLEKPEVPARKCNEKPCITEWRVGKWGRCRACKKKGGVRLRDVQCVKQNPNPIGDYIIVEDSECKEVKPGRVELCETKKKCRSHSRRSVFIPGKFQEGLWKQMNKLHIKKRGSESLAFRKGHFPTSSTMTSPLTWIPTLNHDKNDSKLVIDHGSTNPLIPMKSSHRSKCINLDQEKELELPVNPISSTPNTNRSTC